MDLVHAVAPGLSFPLGATLCAGGANFSLYARRATAVELCLFDRVDDASPSRVIRLDPPHHRTFHYWHAFVAGVESGQRYGYRVHGPFAPERGLRFDPEKLLLDPYGKSIEEPPGRSRNAAAAPGDNTATALKSVIVDTRAYDWEGDRQPRRPFADTVIYEMHLANFTRHPNSGVAAERRGTFAGLINKIPYLQDLGITAVELLPVYAFDAQAAPPGRVNDWGYQPLSFFALHAPYSSRPGPLEALDEFRDMVKALHRAGIEVILDVVYNHTAEGGADGPTLCFRGLANGTYYILGGDRATYADFTGCGNTLNANHAVVRRMILDSLRYWVTEMHVDGFRFDLASALTRDGAGQPMASAPILHDIESDPLLANVKLIAEAWDAAGLYEVGSFSGDSWKEWNGCFRDNVRAFVKSDDGTVPALAARLTGSPDLYLESEREPERSINFVTCHDGFTLNDLVSYNVKHNEANGENNRDGANDNRSWNSGVEGPSDDPAIEQLRNRQIKNFLALTLLAMGTPMLLMGDEVRRTQHGNNNAYCCDGETGWFDWTDVERHADIHRFVRELIALRLHRDLPRSCHDLTLRTLLDKALLQWHGVRLGAPDWGESSHSLAATIQTPGSPRVMHLMVNAYWEALDFEVPPVRDLQGPWRRCVDTFLAAPDDVRRWDEAPLANAPTYQIAPRSLVLLLARSHADG
ncbi:MAG: glycogen debranching protein GlgX [Betaproteobacteria bacterium]|nr:glycogen debranching protein GlgX [Betaproteobacteria bacterium]